MADQVSHNNSLAGKRALVTGGTLGIGRGIARVLREHGATVGVTGINQDECGDATADGFAATVLDVRERASCRRAREWAQQELGGLDILASNAGIYPQARIAEMTDTDLRDIFDVNVFGTERIIQAMLPLLRESRTGRVVVTSSITGNVTGYPGWAHYGATKAAQMGLVRSAAIELAPDGITVNAVLPGNVVTPGLEALGKEYMDRMARAVPLGCLGHPRDIGEAVAFFASPAAGYITGQSLIVDGGQILPESPEALRDIRK